MTAEEEEVSASAGAGGSGRRLCVVAFSINPLFPDRVNGGSVRQLQAVATRLARGGHRVRILCTRRADNARRFTLEGGVEVLPVLDFQQPFPQPYDISPPRLAGLFETIAAELVGADRFYLHDGELLFPGLYGAVPTVVSFRDHAYPETGLGTFVGQGDATVVISEYSRRLVLATAGRFLPGLEERLVRIDNGVELDRFRPGPPDPAFARALGVDPERHRIVLHPHRPEPEKGLADTVAVVHELVRGGRDDIRVLVPRWFDESLSPAVRSYYEGVRHEIAERALSEHFVFHDWVGPDQMADYYRLGRVTLSLGSFVEAFGNCVYESLACGVPAVVVRVGAHRLNLPDEALPKVDPGDLRSAVELASAALDRRWRLADALRDLLEQRLSRRRQVDEYARVIVGAQKLPPLVCRPLSPELARRFRPAPWVLFRDGRAYHDFEASWRPAAAIAALALRHPEGVSREQAREEGVSPQQLLEACREELLVPVA